VNVLWLLARNRLRGGCLCRVDVPQDALAALSTRGLGRAPDCRSCAGVARATLLGTCRHSAEQGAVARGAAPTARSVLLRKPQQVAVECAGIFVSRVHVLRTTRARRVHKLDRHAAASYSWISPPRRSRRLTRSGGTIGVSEGSVALP